MTNPSCPRCGRVFSEWQPVHLTCLLHRLRYFIIALVVVTSLCAVAVVYVLQGEQITALAAKPSLEEAADGQGAPDGATAAVAVAPTATPTAIPIASPTPEQPTSTYTPEILTPILSPSPEVEGTINTGTLNLRAGPGVEYPSLAKLDDGAKFIVIGKNGDWLQVQAPGGLIGWLNGKYAIITGLLDAVAEVAAPETTPTLPTPELQPTASPATPEPQPTVLPPTPEPQPTALPQPIPSPTPVPPPEPNLLATNRGDFLNGQGVGGWKYLMETARGSGVWQEMQSDGTCYRSGGWEADVRVCPDGEVHPGQSTRIAYEWRPVSQGNLKITVHTHKIDTRCGDGVWVGTYRARDGVGFEQELGSIRISGGDNSGRTETYTSEADSGNLFYTIVDIHGDSTCDLTRVFIDIQ